METNNVKKIVVLGEPDSLWFKEFVIDMLCDEKYDISIVCTRNKNRQYENEYRKNNINIIELDRDKYKPVKSLFEKIFSYLLLEKIILKNNYDIAINMFVNPLYLITLLKLKLKYKTKILAYFCGSDIICANKFLCLFYRIVLFFFDGILFCNNNSYKSFKIKVFDKNNKDMTVIDLGNPTLPYIENYIHKMHNLNKKGSKIYVTIGYNGKIEQNHISIIKSLNLLSVAVKNKLALNIPMMYGADQLYINRINNITKTIGIEYIIFDSLMSREKMAELWAGSDAMIYAQNTDGLSGSVIEALCAGNALFMASWIKYDEFYDFGLKWKYFDKYSELPNLITDFVNNYSCKDFTNYNILKNKFSVTNSRKKWQNYLLSI